MTAQVLSVVEVRRQFADVLGRVAYGREEVVIKRAGRPMAVLISVEEFQRLKALDRERRAAERAARFDLIRQAGQRNALSDEEAFTVGLELTDEVRHGNLRIGLGMDQVSDISTVSTTLRSTGSGWP